MQGKKHKKNLIAIFTLSLLMTLLFFASGIGVSRSYAKSADEGIQQQHRNEISAVKSSGRKSRFTSPETANSSASKMLKIFGSQTFSPGNAGIQEVKRYIDAFFAHVDRQPYAKPYGSFGDSRQLFKETIAILSANPPTVTRETDSFRDVCKNVFYFYRVLGSKRILFLKDVLTNEPDLIEPMMACFYRWLTHNPAASNRNDLRLSIEQLCGYAGFFLETFGGRSYLFRRSTKVRTLVSYYCVLAVNKADREGYNPYGLDIRPHLELVFENITQQAGLDDKGHYLDELAELRKKYNIYTSK